ncbi:hypothetical protein [Okeania sp. SIO1H2]|uniref:hypothetical protein n=1 Tax=Okeania sp. SIO1H2 TaxID=2607775 RepID=UPI00141C515A|nr:hypothetical protein [Okeania sp. SIO1H2]NET92708.1 hypothetical protein [Okeania sp. SIO1H2]
MVSLLAIQFFDRSQESGGGGKEYGKKVEKYPPPSHLFLNRSQMGSIFDLIYQIVKVCSYRTPRPRKSGGKKNIFPLNISYFKRNSLKGLTIYQSMVRKVGVLALVYASIFGSPARVMVI